jgi:hypothetical protein
MKQYKKFGSWLKDVRHELAKPGKAAPYPPIMTLMGGLNGLFAQLVAEPESMAQLLEVGRALRAQSGPGLIVAEECFWGAVVSLARKNAAIVRGDDEMCGDEAADDELALEGEDDEGEEALADSSNDESGAKSALKQRAGAALQVLCDEAVRCHSFSRVRDGFGVRRRAACFDVWAQAITVVDSPEVFALARQAACSAKGEEATSAVAFLDALYRAHDVGPDVETERNLKALMKRATSARTVCAVLDLLVEAGLMSEWKASDAMKLWEAKRYGRPSRREDDTD